VIIEKEEYQMQRVEFLNPEAEVVKFEAEDVITTSNPGGGLVDGGVDNGNSDNEDVDNLFP
jgi:F420-0:gamma-glutamyl ligase